MNRKLTIHTALAVTLTLSGFSALSARAQAPVFPVASLMIGVPQDADTLFNQGVELQDAMKYPEAIKKYTEAINKRKTFYEAYLNRGICYLETKDFAKAAEDFSFCVMRKPQVADGYINRAQAYTELKRYPEALKDYETAVALPRLDPANKQTIFLNRAATYYNMGDYDKAIADYGNYITAAGAKAEPIVYLNKGLANLNKARKLVEEKNEAGATAAYNAAAEDFGKYIAAKADDPEGYVSRAEAYIGAKQYDKAVPDLNKYLAQKTDDPVAYALRAQAYLGMNPPNDAAAVKDIDVAIAKAPDNPAIAGLRLQLAAAKYKNKDYKGAIAEATKLLSVASQAKNQTALTIRAQSYSDMAAANPADAANKANLANAIKDYDVLIQLDPKDSTSLRNRGVAYYRLDQYDKAIADFDAFIAAKPNEPDGYNFKGLALLKMNPPQYDKAIQAYSTYLTKKPDDTIALYNRGLAYFGAKQYEKAIPDFQAAAKNANHPNIKDIPGYIAESYINSGNAADAEKAYDQAIAANPNDGEAYLNRGVTRFNIANAMKDEAAQKQKYTAALADFDKAATLLKNNPAPMVNRALTNFKLAQWDAAIKDASAALAIKADSPDALITRADAYYNAANAKNKDKALYASAIADYQKYLALPGIKPEQQVTATEGMALAAIAAGNYQAALDGFTKLLATDPNNTLAIRGRALTYFNMKQYDNALKDFDAFMAKKADDPVAYFNRGLTYKAKGDPAKAAADFEKSFTLKADASAANNAGQTYLEVGDASFDAEPDKAYELYDKAVSMFDKAVAADPNGADSYYNKALALVKKGRAAENKTQIVDSKPFYTDAITAYQMYLQKAMPNPPADAEEVKKQIEILKEKVSE